MINKSLLHMQVTLKANLVFIIILKIMREEELCELLDCYKKMADDKLVFDKITGHC